MFTAVLPRPGTVGAAAASPGDATVAWTLVVAVEATAAGARAPPRRPETASAPAARSAALRVDHL
jgi:hypothetical protein